MSGSGSGSGSKPENPKLDIVILGGLGGRVDQAFSQIHHLYSMSVSPDTRSGDLYLVSEESVTFVLRRGRNVIYTPGTVYKSESRSGQKEGEGREGEGGYLSENAGIIPLTGPTSISTKGFQWDVQDWRTEIGGQLSTSNHIRAQRVEVDCAEAVLFTVELAERLKFGRGGL